MLFQPDMKPLTLLFDHMSTNVILVSLSVYLPKNVQCFSSFLLGGRGV